MKIKIQTYGSLLMFACMMAGASLFLMSCTQQTVTIGALLPLTGVETSVGQSASAAVEIAVEDVNAYLKEKGAAFTIVLKTADTKADPQTALEEAKKLKAAGIDLFIGPITSNETAYVIDWANDNGTVLISQCTAPFLAIADDNLFRLTIDDTHQAEEIVTTMRSEGMKAIVPVYRFDVYAMQLLSLVKEDLAADKEILTDGVPYVYGAVELSAVVSQLSQAVQKEVSQYGASAVGVYLVAFDEGAEILALAKDDPVLSGIAWYGSDSLALDSSLIDNAAAGQFAANRQIVFPAFESDGGVDKDILAKIQNKIGRYPESEALQAYDAVWIAALAYLNAGMRADANALKAAIPTVAGEYTGATGTTKLNNAGDRADGTYAYWAVKENGGQLQWTRQESP
ncbi:MAG: ABC transporter substrate-binding protein [Proteobacteria bacterium]|nr:ABC transporter substrate-binding protein [Pseudomonadota bacterium]